MVFLATVDPSPRPQPMKFPVFSQLAREFGDSETGSLRDSLLQRRVHCELAPHGSRRGHVFGRGRGLADRHHR